MLRMQIVAAALLAAAACKQPDPPLDYCRCADHSPRGYTHARASRVAELVAEERARSGRCALAAGMDEVLLDPSLPGVRFQIFCSDEGVAVVSAGLSVDSPLDDVVALAR